MKRNKRTVEKKGINKLNERQGVSIMQIELKDLINWLPVKKYWFKQWKAREQKKDQTQRVLDNDYYWACKQRNWNKAKQLFDLGATNDFIYPVNGTTPFILLYSYEQKEMMNKMIKKHPAEYERSMEVLLAVQKHFSEEIKQKLDLSFGTGTWIQIWNYPELLA